MTFLITIIPILIYLAIITGIIILIYSWVTRFIRLKEEQNDLLREIIKKMDSR